MAEKKKAAEKARKKAERLAGEIEGREKIESGEALVESEEEGGVALGLGEKEGEWEEISEGEDGRRMPPEPMSPGVWAGAAGRDDDDDDEMEG